MKKLVASLLVLLTASMFANESLIFGYGFVGSFSADDSDYHPTNLDFSTDFDIQGVGLNFLRFQDTQNLYFSLSLGRSSGDGEGCYTGIQTIAPVNLCPDLESDGINFGGEIGRKMNRFTPFLGINYSQTEVEALFPATGPPPLFNFEIDEESETSFHAGVWFTRENTRFRATMYSINNEESREISFGIIQSPSTNKFAIGGELRTLINDNSNGTSVALYFGWRL